MDKKNEILADAEQIEASVQSVARIVSAYYNELIANGINPDFARELTTQYSQYIQMSMFEAFKRSQG